MCGFVDLDAIKKRRKASLEGIKKARENGTILGRPKKIDKKRAYILRQQGYTYRQIAEEMNIGIGGAYSAVKNFK